MSVLSRYQNMDSQLALRLATDKHFMVTMTKETDEQRIEQLIESKFVDIAREYQALAEEEKRKNIHLAKDLKEKSSELDSKEKSLTIIQSEKNSLQGENKLNQEALDSAKQEIMSLNSTNINMKRVSASLGILLISLMIWFNPWFFLGSSINIVIGKLLTQLSELLYSVKLQ